MIIYIKNNYKNIVIALSIAMFFACEKAIKEMNNPIDDKKEPIAIVDSLNTIYKNYGEIVINLKAPVMLDFSNIETHPYKEFIKGIHLVRFNTKVDSISVFGDYAISHESKKVTDLRGNVIIINHSENSRLDTEQLYWDQNTGYFFTEKKYKLNKNGDIYYGKGFESNESLENFETSEQTGSVNIKEGTDEQN